MQTQITTDPDIRAFLDWFCGDRNKSERTGAEYARDLARFSRFIEPASLNDATPEQIQGWMRTLRDANKPQSIRRKVAAISTYFTWREKKGLSATNPCRKVDLPAVTKSLPKSMSERDVERLLNAKIHHRRHAALLDARDAAMFELMYGSGLRRFEVCGLDLDDLDFEERQVRVRHGKGDKERYSFLSEPTIAKIGTYLALRQKYATDASGQALFITAIERKRLTPRQLWCEFKRARTAAGLEGKCVPHTMRHAFATHSYRHGMGLRELQVLLGHASIATTERYTKVTLEHARAAYERSHPRAKGAA